MHTTLVTMHDIRHIVKSVGTDALMRQMIHALEVAFRCYDPATTQVPSRSGFSYDEPHVGLLEWMPVLTHGQTATIKMVGYHPHNPEQHELPTILSSVGTYDVRTGQLTAVMDGTFLTALRTGAASGLAAAYLAHPDSQTMGIIGAGAQAITQLHAVATACNLRQVYVYDTDSAAAISFARRAEFLNLPIQVVRQDQIERLVAESDVLCTATSTAVGSPPVFDDTAVKPWLHINAIGSDFPGKTELPEALVRRALVCPDFLEQALVEGECQRLDEDSIGPTLHEIVKSPERYTDYRDALTVFDSTGWALEDSVAAELLLNHARRLGLGQKVHIQHTPVDPLNPYDFA